MSRKVQFPITLKSGNKEIVIGSDRSVAIGNAKKQQTSSTKQVKSRDQNANAVGRSKVSSTVRTSQPAKTSKVKTPLKAQQTKAKAKPGSSVNSRINTAEATPKAVVSKPQITKNEPYIAPEKQLAATAPINNFNLPENDLLSLNTAEKELSKTQPISYQSDQQESSLIAPINDDNLIKSIKMHTHDSSDNQAMMGKLLNDKWKKDLDQQIQEKNRRKHATKNRKGEVEDYNPWGKPGCGAPLVSDAGDVINDYRRRKLNQSTDQPIQTESPPRKEVISKAEEDRLLSTQTDQQRTSLSVANKHNDNLPSAMRSSMIIGEVAPSNWIDQKKEQEKRQWLADLERQIRSKEQQKSSKIASKVEDQSDYMIQSRRQIPSTGNQEDDSKTFLRGRGFALDSQTQKQLEAKRQREIQHQNYIKQQIEEKQRLKQRELDKELDLENAQVQHSEFSSHAVTAASHTVTEVAGNDPQEMPISELKQASYFTAIIRKGNSNVDETYQKILAAQEAARLAKKEKLMRKLKSHGHDVSNLYQNQDEHRVKNSVDNYGYNKSISPKIMEAVRNQQYNTSPLMHGPSDQDNDQQFSPRRTQEGFLLDSSSHAIPVPIDQLAEEEGRLKEEMIPQQSQIEYVSSKNSSSEELNEEYSEPEIHAPPSNKAKKSPDKESYSKNKGRKSNLPNQEQKYIQESQHYSKTTKSRAIKTQDKVKNNDKSDELRRERNKVNNPTNSKINNASIHDRRDKAAKNKKPSIRLTDNPKTGRTPRSENDLLEESFSPEPQLNSQKDYVKKHFKGMKELESHSELSPIKTVSPIPSNDILAMKLTNYELEAEIRNLKQQIQELGREALKKRQQTPPPPRNSIPPASSSNDLPNNEVLSQLATLRKGLLIKRNELERAYTPYSAQVMADPENV